MHFFRVYIASSKYKDRDHVSGFHNVRELFQSPIECLDEAMETRKKGRVAFIKQFSKIIANLNFKHHNRVYIFSSKHTYRPMRARVVNQLFHNSYLTLRNTTQVLGRLVIDFIFFQLLWCCKNQALLYSLVGAK